MSNGGSSPIDINSETLAQFLAKSVSDGTWSDVIEALKVDKAGEAAAATDIVDAAGQLWSNVQDDMFKLIYAALHNAGKIWRAADLTALQALGTDNGLVAGALGIATDTGILFRCTSAIAASSTWGGLLANGLQVEGASDLVGAVTVGDGGGYRALNLDYGTANVGDFNVRIAGVLQFRWRSTQSTDTYALSRFDGVGTYQDDVFVVSGTTGIVAFSKTIEAPNVCKFVAGIRTSGITFNAGERRRYNAAGGTFTLTAPASPVIGDRFAVKEAAGDATGVTIDGNGNNIFDPVGLAFGASFSLATAWVSVEWEFDGFQWQVI